MQLFFFFLALRGLQVPKLPNSAKPISPLRIPQMSGGIFQATFLSIHHPTPASSHTHTSRSRTDAQQSSPYGSPPSRDFQRIQGLIQTQPSTGPAAHRLRKADKAEFGIKTKGDAGVLIILIQF